MRGRVSHILPVVVPALLLLPVPVRGQTRAAEPGGGAAGAATDALQSAVERLTDIVDIKPPETAGPGMDRLWLYLFGALLLASLMVGAFLLWRKYRKERTSAPAAVEPPHAEALRLLADLESRPGTDPKAFYFRLSAILRGYIHGRFGIEAVEMTSEELIPQVGALGLGDAWCRGIREFVHATDPVKFADYPADRLRLAADLAFVKRFVAGTTEPDS